MPTRVSVSTPFTVVTVFYAALSFRLNWEGNYRTLEAQAEASIENKAHMDSSIAEVLRKLNAEPKSQSVDWQGAWWKQIMPAIKQALHIGGSAS